MSANQNYVVKISAVHQPHENHLFQPACQNIGCKQIASGFGNKLGDVDLFGHEPSPTLEERRMRLASEKQFLDDIDDFLKGIKLYKDNVNPLNTDQSCNIYSKLVKSISFFRECLRQLRELEWALNVRRIIFLTMWWNQVDLSGVKASFVLP